jgi:hypothetical protein
MGRRQKQAAEMGDALVTSARDAALAAARAGGAVGPFAALSGLMGGVGAPAALGAGVDFAALAALGLYAPAALAQSRAALLGGAGVGPAPAPGFSAADVAALARAMAENATASAPGGAKPPGASESATPPGASESAGAGAAWGKVAAETKGGAAAEGSLAALRALGGDLTLQHAAEAQAKSLQALSALAAQRPAPPALPVPGLSGFAGLGALAAAGNLSALQAAAYAGGLGGGAGFPGLGGGVPGPALSNISALHALSVLGGLPGAAAAAAVPPPGSAAASDAGTLRALEAMMKRAQNDPASLPSKTAAESETVSPSGLDLDSSRPLSSAKREVVHASPPRDEKETNGASARQSNAGLLKASALSFAAKDVDALAARRSPSPPARVPRENPFGAESEGYSLVHAAKRAKRDAIAVAGANHVDAEAE